MGEDCGFGKEVPNGDFPCINIGDVVAPHGPRRKEPCPPGTGILLGRLVSGVRRLEGMRRSTGDEGVAN